MGHFLVAKRCFLPYELAGTRYQKQLWANYGIFDRFGSLSDRHHRTFGRFVFIFWP